MLSHRRVVDLLRNAGNSTGPTSRRASALATAVICALLSSTACTSVNETIRASRYSKTGTISQSSLSAIPCVKEAAQTAYGVTADIDYENLGYATTNTTSTLGAPTKFVLYLNQSEPTTEDAKKPSGPRVRFEFWSRSSASTGVRYWVDAPDSERAALEEKALNAIEQCGGSSEIKRSI